MPSVAVPGLTDSLPATPPTVGQTLAFRCGARAFSLGEILRCLGPFHPAPPEGGPELEPALAAFRYERDLVSAEECEHWLALRGLTYDDLVESVTRRLDETGPVNEAGPQEIDRILASEFPALARRFAWQVALAVEQGRALPPGEEELAAMLAAAQSQARATSADTAGRTRRLAARRLALSRVTVESAEFDEAGAAREACHCLNVDRATYAELARVSGCAHETWEGFFADLPEDWRSALLGREIGQATALALEDGRHLVLGLRRRALPSLADDEVCRRLDDEAMEETCAELELRHVQWLIPL